MKVSLTEITDKNNILKDLNQELKENNVLLKEIIQVHHQGQKNIQTRLSQNSLTIIY